MISDFDSLIKVCAKITSICQKHIHYATEIICHHPFSPSKRVDLHYQN